MSLEAFRNYLSLERNYSVHTVKAYARDIADFETFCRDELEIQELSAVEYNAIRSWIVKLVEQGLSNRSVNRKIASLNAF